MTTEEMKQQKVEKTWVIFRVIEAVVLIVTGVLNIIYFQNTGFTKIIFYVIGSLFAVDGIMAIIKYYISPIDASAIVQELIISIFEIAFGVLFIVDAAEMLNVLENFLALFISVVLFSAAFVFGLGATIAIINKKRKMWVAVVEYIVTALLIAGGVLLVIYRENAKTYIWYAVVILCGLVMVGMGVYALVSAFLPFRQKKPKKVKPEPIKPDDGAKKPIDVEKDAKKEEPKEDKEQIKDYNSKQIEHNTDQPKQIVVDVQPEKSDKK